MRSLAWLMSLGLCASAWGEPLHYEQKLTEGHGPVELHVSQPVFKGGDPATAERLNQWVKQTIGDLQCPSFGYMPSSYVRDLTVDRLTGEYLVISDSAEELCGGYAHENFWHAQFVIPLVTGEPLDVWGALSEATQEHLRQQLVARGHQQFGDDGCGRTFQDTGWLEQLSFRFAGSTVVIASDLPYVVRACNVEVAMPLAEFRASAEASPELRAFLDSW